MRFLRLLLVGLIWGGVLDAQEFPTRSAAQDAVAGCLAGSGQEECLLRYLTRLQMQLQQVYTELAGTAQGRWQSPAQEWLAKSQAAWTDFRNTSCEYESRLAAPAGSRTVRMQCQISMTVERGSYLKRFAKKERRGVGLPMNAPSS
ncbi:MAG TPA: lysozyme inhibitor LprI family protein [Bryobacteraceae bacterium]|jgi:uncharacterized protein YecT (DUF1311 family)